MQKARLVTILILSFIAVCGAAYFFEINLSGNDSPILKSQIIINNQTVFVEVADTPALREQGLSGRRSLKDNEGMLFIFDAPVRPGFWMKEMLFPIDIIWVSDNNTIVDISENLLPSSYPRIFSPKTEIKYVLEVPSGFVEKNKVKIGDRMTIE